MQLKHAGKLHATPLHACASSSCVMAVINEPLILCGCHMRAPSMMPTRADDMPLYLPDPRHCCKNVSEVGNVLQLKPAILGHIWVPLLLYLLVPLHQFLVFCDLQANSLLQRA